MSFDVCRQIFNCEFSLEFFKQKKDQCHIGEYHKNLTEQNKKEKEFELQSKR